MNCPKCNMNVRPIANYCIKCGYELRSDQTFRKEANSLLSVDVLEEKSEIISDIEFMMEDVNSQMLYKMLYHLEKRIDTVYDKLAEDVFQNDKSRIYLKENIPKLLKNISLVSEIQELKHQDSEKAEKSLEKWYSLFMESLDEIEKKMLSADILELSLELEAFEMKLADKGLLKSDFDIG